MRRLLIGLAFLVSLPSFGALAPAYQSANELKEILSEALDNLNNQEIVKELASRGGEITLTNDEIGYSLQSTASGPCLLRIEIIYPEIDFNQPIAGPAPFAVKKNTVDDVICPLN